jgi:hypothetical protein
MPARHDYSRALQGAASESPPGRNPRAAVRGCRLWGFNGAAAWVGDAFAGVRMVAQGLAAAGTIEGPQRVVNGHLHQISARAKRLLCQRPEP